MGYLDDYNNRLGKCEYCKYHASGSYRCKECDSNKFEDVVDLYTFIRAQSSKEAIKKFNESAEGKRLHQIMEEHRIAYNTCRDEYNKARELFIDAELKRVENSINAI